jgi:hypothetical protein
MAADLGGSQISALLESVPGIRNVLRSPVADALVNMIRAGAHLRPFAFAEADELVQYAVRRGLIGSTEGEQVLADVRGAESEARRRARAERNAGSKSHPPKGCRSQAGSSEDRAAEARQEGRSQARQAASLDGKSLHQGAQPLGDLTQFVCLGGHFLG